MLGLLYKSDDNRSTNHVKYDYNDPVRRFLIKRFFSQLIKDVSHAKPQSLADIGCGEGFVLKTMLDNSIVKHDENGFHAAGIDISKSAVAVAQKQLPGLNIQVGSIYEIPFEDNSHDVVLCNEVLEHLENPAKALQELRRVSSKYVIVSVPHEPWFMLGSLFGGKYIKAFGNHPEHINHWNPLSLKKTLKENGLHVEKIRFYSTFPWLLAVCRV